MSKVYSDPTSALDGLLHDNMTVAAGGFCLCGIPEKQPCCAARQRCETVTVAR